MLKLMDPYNVSNWSFNFDLGVGSHVKLPFFGTLRYEIKKNKLVQAVFLDLSKAIDTLSHENLPKKIEVIVCLSFGRLMQ